MVEIKNPGAFAAQREAWSEADPRTVVTHRDDVEHIEFGGQDIAILVSGEDTTGRWPSSRSSLDPGLELFFRNAARSMKAETPADQMVESVKNYDVVF